MKMERQFAIVELSGTSYGGPVKSGVTIICTGYCSRQRDNSVFDPTVVLSLAKEGT